MMRHAMIDTGGWRVHGQIEGEETAGGEGEVGKGGEGCEEEKSFTDSLSLIIIY